jgi:hypothetical protein
VYAYITVESIALDTPTNVEVFITDVPDEHTPTIYPFSKSEKSPTF